MQLIVFFLGYVALALLGFFTFAVAVALVCRLMGRVFDLADRLVDRAKLSDLRDGNHNS